MRLCRVSSLLTMAIIAGALTPGDSSAIRTVRVASALNRPILVTAPAGDDRLFILEQRGVIKILKNGSVLPVPFLNIDALVPNITGNDERGLLGMAFHPEYDSNGYFYVNYTEDITFNTVVARYKVSASDPDVAEPDSVRQILYIIQPFTNHNGGNLLFGPDDYLYIGMGDGGSAGDPGNRAQNPLELLGKMLRIDIDNGNPYSVPPSNPFVGQVGYRGEIWALGLRNPWRFSFDRLTGDIYIGDVGQNDWEEIDYQAALPDTGGQNYGWRLKEGDHCFNPPINCEVGAPFLTDPIHEYPHSDGCSVTGGYVYRGEMIPSLQGTYFFADFCSARIWSFRYDGSNLTQFTDRTAELAPGGGQSIGSIASFGEDGFGEMYIVDRDAGTSGEVFKIIPNAADAPDHAISSQGMGLGLCSPNPFAVSTRFEAMLDRPGNLEVSVHDLTGRRVHVLASGQTSAGAHPLRWDGRDELGNALPSGVYFLRASFEGHTVSRPVQLLR